MTKEKTRKYIVTEPNTLDHEIGDVIELTDKRAKGFVNKVRLQSDGSLSGSINVASNKLKKENEALKRNSTKNNDTITSLESDVESLKKKLAEATK